MEIIWSKIYWLLKNKKIKADTCICSDMTSNNQCDFYNNIWSTVEPQKLELPR